MVLLAQQSPASCADLAGCRGAAIDAQARKDYEAFHDLAWLAYRKGRPDDTDLMLLLARAQSLSGRPTDALVMLKRIMARGVATDAATSDDFARVRALPAWKEISGEGTANAAEKPSTPAPAPAPTTTEPPPPKPAGPPANSGRRVPGAPLAFTTLLKPTALAYDAVSKRYLIADRTARRVAVIDESSGHVATLAGTQAALGEIAGIAIDPTQGDLWVVSATPEGTRLHRLQLISGRVISTVPVSGAQAPLVGLTFVRGTGLVTADSSGTVWRVSARGALERLTELEYGPRILTSDSAGRIYVSPGGSRVARFPADSSAGTREVLTLPDDAAVEGGIAIVANRLHFLALRDGSYEIRTTSLKR